MIDTVVLLIPFQQFKIEKPSIFNPDASLVCQSASIKSVLNPLKKETTQGIYKPRLTLSRRKNLQGISEIMLTIEFSLPKLMLGNNIEELQLKDFSKVISKLHTTLDDMGIEIALPDLQNAEIIAIHYSKNIALTDGSTPFHYIQKIQQLAAPSFLDSNQTSYRNAGSCYKYHSNSYEVVFYDKIYDLYKAQKSKKRAIDAINFVDLKQLEKLRTKRKKFEILRMEVRLNTRRKIKSLFTKLKVKTDLTLRKLFRPATARKVLLHYVTMLESKSSSFIDFKPLSDQELLTTLALHNPDLKPKQILQFFGFKKALETMTIDEIKKIIAKENHVSWNRLIKELESIVTPSRQKSFDIIRKQIEEYKPLKLRK